MKSSNSPHPNKYLKRVYPTQKQIELMQFLDRMQSNAPCVRFPFTRRLANFVLSFLRSISALSYKLKIKKRSRELINYRLFGIRLAFIDWYFVPQDSDYRAIFLGYEYGFYDMSK